MDKLIYGADSETLHGKPMTLQFYSEDTACDEIHWVNEKTSAKTFLAWCKRRAPRVQHILYVHNLGFDLIEFLWGHHAKLVEKGGEFEFTIAGWTIKGVYGSPTFCRITDSDRRTIMLCDTYSYFRGSLAKGAALFCPDLPKLRHPANLGSRLFTKRDSGFVDYAMRDAVVTYHMGKAIEAMHQEYDLQQCISVADMAARIFRHRFLSYTIPQPDREVIDASVLSYHGGKNNVTVPAGWYEGVSSLDISSAYPHAMHELPAFSNAKLYRSFKGSKHTRAVPDCGVYRVSGSLSDCQWPVVFSHAFKPLHGRISDVWVQGFELNEALRSGEFKPASIVGTMYDRERDNQAPALRGFVETFYKLKEAETDPVRRYMQKLILNSVSGKFIQTRKKQSVAYSHLLTGETVDTSEVVAGGLFHPFIASAITAHTRARIHQLEHKHKALHTATDGIMTQRRDVKAVGKGLGALTLEASDATLLLVRNKLYVLYGKEGKKTTPSYGFKGQHIIKYALHGFQGNVSELERLVATGRRAYEIEKPNTLKQSVQRKLTPNEFTKRRMVLKIGEIPLRKTSSFRATDRARKRR